MSKSISSNKNVTTYWKLHNILDKPLVKQITVYMFTKKNTVLLSLLLSLHECWQLKNEINTFPLKKTKLIYFFGYILRQCMSIFSSVTVQIIYSIYYEKWKADRRDYSFLHISQLPYNIHLAANLIIIERKLLPLNHWSKYLLVLRYQVHSKYKVVSFNITLSNFKIQAEF